MLKNTLKSMLCLLLLSWFSWPALSQVVTLQALNVLVSPNVDELRAGTLVTTLQEEVAKRTGIECRQLQQWPKNGHLLVLALDGDGRVADHAVPNHMPLQAEGYFVKSVPNENRQIIWIVGKDNRGLLYGLGHLLRKSEMRQGSITLTHPLDVCTSPQYSLRGHQLGYRNTANSWDAWTPEQYEQYIRELALFGTNAIEDIPFQSTGQSVKMIMPHTQMHPIISDICHRYDLDYWVWTPAAGDLSDDKICQKALKIHEDFYKSVPRLDAIFFPGGDPGDNHPKYVLPHLQQLAALLHKYHPKAGVWISLQGFEGEKLDYFFDYINKNQPDWLTGVVYGPSSPPIDVERRMLPKKYKHRLYGDLTHTVRCQYPAQNLDQAFALTLGREGPNPQPVYYTDILKTDGLFTDGFISYSDGAHDDVNKIIWNQVGWNSQLPVRDILMDYGRFFFGPDLADAAADGILALEKNWIGPLVDNGAVTATQAYWHKLETDHPALSNNWRWQLLLLRAYYDAYTRERQIYEKALEKQAYAQLIEEMQTDTERAMQDALVILQKADSQPVCQPWKKHIEELAESLYALIGLQSSVSRYQASGAERGCFMDFIDFPLNNRWWLEDEFKKISAMANKEAKIERLQQIIHWDNPGPGGFYDNISDVSASPHVVSHTDDAIDFAWWDGGRSRRRLSTQVFQFSPVLKYVKLDATANYLIRLSGYGEALLRANGVRLEPTRYEKELETFKEFVLPARLIPAGTLTITFDKPDEAHLNWRKYSKVMEVWLIKQPQ